MTPLPLRLQCRHGTDLSVDVAESVTIDDKIIYRTSHRICSECVREWAMDFLANAPKCEEVRG